MALVEQNDAGLIEKMILKNVTGDTAKYGILMEVKEGKDNDSYTCIIDGTSKNYSNADISFNVEEGPVAVYLEGNSLGRIKNLEKVEGGVSSVSPVSLTSTKGEEFLVAVDVVVYRYEKEEYFLSDVDEAISGDYNVSAYYDKEMTDGGRVRVLILR